MEDPQSANFSDHKFYISGVILLQFVLLVLVYGSIKLVPMLDKSASQHN